MAFQPTYKLDVFRMIRVKIHLLNSWDIQVQMEHAQNHSGNMKPKALEAHDAVLQGLKGWELEASW